MAGVGVGGLPGAQIDGPDLSGQISQASNVHNKTQEIKFCAVFVDTVVQVLCCTLAKAVKVLRFAGKKVDSQIVSTGITTAVGVVFPAPGNGTIPVSWIEYAKCATYALSCLLVIISWIIKPMQNGASSSPTPSPKERRMRDLSYLAGGCGLFFMVLAIFGNIFSALPLVYSITSLCTCVVLVSLAAIYGSFLEEEER